MKKKYGGFMFKKFFLIFKVFLIYLIIMVFFDEFLYLYIDCVWILDVLVY